METMEKFDKEQQVDGCGDFEALPALSEEEENVSLADVLSLQDSCLTEDEIWAICLECSKSLKSISHAPIFQTLCITPDTLAFNTNGNVCFMEDISDDPEGAFTPPEIDVTGNTFAAHIFSLGATLEAVVEYMMEPEIYSECSQDLHTLLEKMQEENPKDRPEIEDVIFLCEEKLKLSSSSDICQCLSAIGRTVLSMESCGAFEDSCNNLWKRRDNQKISLYEQCADDYLRENSSPDVEADSGRNSSAVCIANDQSEDMKEVKNNLVNEGFCYQPVSSPTAKCKEEEKSTEYNTLETKPYTCELGTKMLKTNCLRKVTTFPMLPFESETEPRTFFPIKTQNGPLTRKYNPLQSKSLSLLSNNHNVLERGLNYGHRNSQLGPNAGYFQETNSYLKEFYLNPKIPWLYQYHVKSCDDNKADFQPYNHSVSETQENFGKLNGSNESHSSYQILESYEPWQYCENSPCSNKNTMLGVGTVSTVFTELNKNRYSSNSLNSPAKKLTKRKDCYIEDMHYIEDSLQFSEDRKSDMKNNEQCIFLKHLLTQYGEPLKDYELWALCRECLLTLETYADYPEYLCLDSVMINNDGSILFVPPKSEDSYDMFYLAPEISEEDFVPEKVCIYCIAAILWRAAKCNFPADRKLVLPRKLKNFLLEMARRNSEDRPSLADAIKTCDSYLLEESINSKKVLAFLTKYAFQGFKEADSFNDSLPLDFETERHSVDDNLGFLPMSNESKLKAVKGPVPCQLPLNRENTTLPFAFTSSATHFKPIILHQNMDSKKMDEIKHHGDTFQGQNKPKSFLNANEETNFSVSVADDLPQDNTEKEVRTEIEEECLQTNTTYIDPDFPEEVQSQEELLVLKEEDIYTGSPCLSELNGFCPGWRSAFYGSECFSLEVHDYVRKLGKRRDSGTQNIGAKIVELEQQIMIETKNYNKSRRFYYRLLHKDWRRRGGEVKTMLPKLMRQLEETRSRAHFLELAKEYLQIINTEKWGIEPSNLLKVVNMARNETLGISSLDSMLLFYNINKNQCNKSQYNNSQPRNLHAGTPLGLMAYLYSRNAFLEGYVQQFLFTFRYFCSQEELLQFLLDRISITLPSPENCPLLSKINFRSFSILQMWIESCYAVDFAVNPDFMRTLKDFLISKVVPLSGYSKWLLSWLDLITSRKEKSVSLCFQMENWREMEQPCETQSLRSSCRRLSKNILLKSFNWKPSKRNEVIAPYQKDKQPMIASSLPKQCFTNITESFHGEEYFLTEYTAQQLCCQLTLLEQEMFHKCHPVHFLNSRFLGVKDKSVPLQKVASAELLPTQIYNLFVKNCVQDDYLLQLLKYADNVSTWVAAEIVTSYSTKTQVNLLTKFLSIAKCCYEQRNFATTIQILNGLEHLVVRQLPVWKSLPSKILGIMEELTAVEVFLKSDSLCLMEGERFKTLPTIPSAHVLAMHVQQLETGGFTMKNGTFKWTKLRTIAKVVSQIHAFQENPYMLSPDRKLQSFLRHRIASFNDADISALAAVNSANFHQMPAEKQSRKIQDTLQKMKTMFQ
ncbi:kinase non-catalytic C-lobe domain-containing protein 1 isoform X3 [Anolis carolinensis]|uniref:kinase non-catalytic C-lobe domain-containing protein 1 isoform X3 n=1 Tax=Anolis carolinensis TaxID=28377 RepID=UPI002F2B4998